MTPPSNRAVVTALLPPGSRRQAVAASMGRHVLPRLLDHGGLRSRGRSPYRFEEEERRLRRTWAARRPETAHATEGTGHPDARIDVQSVLGRHALIRALFGSTYDDLMREELHDAARLRQTLREREEDLGGSRVPATDAERGAAMWRVLEPYEVQASAYAVRWRNALRGRNARPLTVLEPACGSASDYRAMAQFGLARFLTYTGIDLDRTTIQRTRRRLPGVDLRVGSILSLPFPDRSVDFVIAYDIFEHLSVPAMRQALTEVVRVSRRGLYLAFSRMAEVPDHVVAPGGSYHCTTLSAPRIRDYLAQAYPRVDVVSIADLLRELHGQPPSGNSQAYSMTTERPPSTLISSAREAMRRRPPAAGA